MAYAPVVFRWPWETDHDDLLPRDHEARALRHLAIRVEHVADQCDRILALLTPHLFPDRAHLLAIGVPMPVELNPDQTTVTYTYTMTRGGQVVPNVGQASYTIDDGSVLAGVQNADGTFTETRVGPAGGVTNTNLQVTLPDGTVLTADPDTVTVDAQNPDAVQLVAGTPS